MRTESNVRVRAYTVPEVAAAVKPSLGAGTIIQAEGLWLGEAEGSVIIEVVTGDPEFPDRFVRLVATEAAALGEDAVLFTVEPIQARLVFTDHAWMESVR